MEKWYRLLGNNRALRLIVGSTIAAFLYGSIASQNGIHQVSSRSLLATANAFPVKPDVEIDNTSKIIDLARTDHIALLKWAQQNYKNRVQDYQGTFYKRERINGKLKKEQIISILFKEEPFSVLMKWKKNAGSVDKLLYVEGSNNNQMIVHPTGLFSWIKSVKRDPRCKEALKSSRNSCDRFGFNRTLESMLKVYELADKEEDLEINYLGQTIVNGRKCAAMERILPANKKYPSQRMVVEIDLEYLLPVSVTSYDWQNKMISRYRFGDLKFNTGLSTQRFTPKANKL